MFMTTGTDDLTCSDWGALAVISSGSHTCYSSKLLAESQNFLSDVILYISYFTLIYVSCYLIRWMDIIIIIDSRNICLRCISIIYFYFPFYLYFFCFKLWWVTKLQFKYKRKSVNTSGIVRYSKTDNNNMNIWHTTPSRPKLGRAWAMDARELIYKYKMYLSLKHTQIIVLSARYQVKLKIRSIPEQDSGIISHNLDNVNHLEYLEECLRKNRRFIVI